MQTIEQIDQAIDANRRVLLGRIKFQPSTAREYQNAWDRYPDLRQREDALFHERGIAQEVRDVAAEKEFQRQERSRRAKQRATDRKANQRRACPTCGAFTLAA